MEDRVPSRPAGWSVAPMVEFDRGPWCLAFPLTRSLSLGCGVVCRREELPLPMPERVPHLPGAFFPM